MQPFFSPLPKSTWLLGPAPGYEDISVPSGFLIPVMTAVVFNIGCWCEPFLLAEVNRYTWTRWIAIQTFIGRINFARGCLHSERDSGLFAWMEFPLRSPPSPRGKPQNVAFLAFLVRVPSSNHRISMLSMPAPNYARMSTHQPYAMPECRLFHGQVGGRHQCVEKVCKGGG